MVEVSEVKSGRDKREFLNFPLKLYKNEKNFVPPLWSDEKKIFSRNYAYYKTCEAVYFLARNNGKVVGRISGIIQKDSNRIREEKRVRFTRFDSIDDIETAQALFSAVENWGREKGMDTIVGPLGFSDLEREGLLIEGFDQPSTFEEQYNYPYYPKLIEALGFIKEVDWTESQLRAPSPEDCEAMKKLSAGILKRYNLHMAEAKSTGDFIDKYMGAIFSLIDKSYRYIYGSVPFNDDTAKMLTDNFRLILKLKYIAMILDSSDNPVCFGFCVPSISEAMKKSSGHLTPAGICRTLNAINNPSVLDLCLVGVDPEYANRGISAIVISELMYMLSQPGIEYAETNLNLENNETIQNMWRRFERFENKRRRAYVKAIGG